MKPSVVAIIPARANSKRIPNKNKKIFGGKPLIDWTIEAALASDIITDILVSTDDEEILKFKSKFPKVIFYKRSAELADDSSPTVDSLVEALTHIKTKYDYIMLLQPTSPLRTSASIVSAFKALQDKGLQQMVSVKPFSETLGHVVLKGSDKIEFPLTSAYLIKNKNNIKVLNGAIYISDWNVFFSEKSFLTKHTDFFEMNEQESVDIDTNEDWVRAEKYLKMKEFCNE